MSSCAYALAMRNKNIHDMIKLLNYSKNNSKNTTKKKIITIKPIVKNQKYTKNK